MVLVKLLAAVICFSGQCYPALVGKHTPVGTFELTHYKTNQQGYGGDILVFAQDKDGVYAIHRVYLLNAKQHRRRRLKSHNPKDREITDGCINVDPIVYKRLLNCCSRDILKVEE